MMRDDTVDGCCQLLPAGITLQTLVTARLFNLTIEVYIVSYYYPASILSKGRQFRPLFLVCMPGYSTDLQRVSRLGNPLCRVMVLHAKGHGRFSDPSFWLDEIELSLLLMTSILRRYACFERLLLRCAGCWHVGRCVR